MSFCTAVNCMDGRVQLPVIAYLKERFRAEYVDTVTEAGPNRILAEGGDGAGSILARVRVSVEKHHSKGIAVVGHHDCAGNPVPYDSQLRHIQAAIAVLRSEYEDLDVVGLWIDERLNVIEVE